PPLRRSGPRRSRPHEARDQQRLSLEARSLSPRSARRRTGGLLRPGRLALPRQGELEGRPPAGRRLRPDPAAVPLDDLLADGQPDAGAGVLIARVQALEDDEDALEVPGLDADAVVPDHEQPLRVLGLDADVDPWPLGAAELDGVADQVLEQGGDLDRVPGHGRQAVPRDLGAALLQGRAQIDHHLLEHGLAVDLLELAGARAGPGIVQEALDQAAHARGAVAGELDELLRVLVEPALHAAR